MRIWKKIGYFLLWFGGILFAIFSPTFALPLWSTVDIKDILTSDSEKIINPELGETNPIRTGIFGATNTQGNKILNLLWGSFQISDHYTATQKTILIVNNIINYILWFASLVALIILIIGWVRLLLASGDEKNSSAAQKSIKRVLFALLWIGLSRLFVSVIFRILQTLVA